MFSLRKLFSRDEKFYDLIEALAQSSASSVKALAATLSDPTSVKSIDELIQKRRKSKEINDQLSHELCVSFVTPLEREDIEALASSLSKISKTSEKFSSQFWVFKNTIDLEDFKKQAVLMDEAADALMGMIKQLRHKPNVESVRVLNEKLRTCESDSDRIMLNLVQKMYCGEKNQPLSFILANKSLQELSEKLTERLRDAGNVIFRIVLKYT